MSCGAAYTLLRRQRARLARSSLARALDTRATSPNRPLRVLALSAPANYADFFPAKNKLAHKELQSAQHWLATFK